MSRTRFFLATTLALALGAFLTATPVFATQACGPGGCKQTDPPDPIGGGDTGTGICVTEYGRTCAMSFGAPVCNYSTDPNSICQHDATKCGCTSGGGSGFLKWNSDPLDERSLIFQDGHR